MAKAKRRMPVVGDRVRARIGAPGVVGGMDGVVEKVTRKAHMSGCSSALVQVRWASGSVGLHADQQIEVQPCGYWKRQELRAADDRFGGSVYNYLTEKQGKAHAARQEEEDRIDPPCERCEACRA